MLKSRLILTALAATLAMPALADGDADKGKKVFNKCKACHAVGEGAANKVGPQLNGIVGAAAGQVEGFKYSDALTEAAAGGLVWDEANLAAFFAKPKDFMKGTKMSFAGLKKEDEIEDVIAYLQGF
ncbi:cytochrome c family protein [Ruegeria sp. PrR005]|uniref:Cytochrome c family protein n=1 Tax=Ruegeria sp. PrR005 TaxID=2706882 RepID=A0A6B2NUV5_9RHOB|nr:cytochrome c family protein [Ruegeria sp. PrR005]NDW47208.1 cytochrome c family protein [Ruegeria sp. PrR005]